MNFKQTKIHLVGILILVKIAIIMQVANLLNYKGQLIVTLGEKGVKWDNLIYPPSRQAEVSDLSGAGDTFFASFIYHYLSHKSISKGISFAQDCSLEVIEKKGVVVIKK